MAKDISRTPGGFAAKFSGRVVGESIAGVAIGAGNAVGGIAQGLGAAAAGTAKGVGTAIGGALQGAFTPADVTINNFGIVGAAGKEKTTGPVYVPNFKATAKPAINDNEPIDKLLGLAIKYLSNIEKTLKGQMAFQMSEARRKKVEERENKIEEVSKPSIGSGLASSLKDKLKAKGKGLVKGLMLSAAILTPLLFAGMTEEQLAETKEKVQRFIKGAHSFAESVHTFMDNIDTIFDFVENLFWYFNPAMLPITIAKVVSNMTGIKIPDGLTEKAFNTKGFSTYTTPFVAGFSVVKDAASSGVSAISKELPTSSRQSETGYIGNNSDAAIIYRAYRAAGLTDEGAKTMVAQIGRENDYRKDIIFGYHKDPANGEVNAGMMSWQKSRGKEFVAYMESQGFIRNGKMARTPAALEAQVRFSVMEMQKSYKKSWNAVTNPNLNYSQIEPIVSTDYVRWDRKGRYHNATKSMSRMNNYYQQAGGGAVNIRSSDGAGEQQASSSGRVMDSLKQAGATSISGMNSLVKQIIAGASKITTFDTDYKPFRPVAGSKIKELNEASKKSEADRIAGTKNKSATMPLSANASRENILKNINGGSLDVINPNYNLGSDSVITNYLQSFGLRK